MNIVCVGKREGGKEEEEDEEEKLQNKEKKEEESGGRCLKLMMTVGTFLSFFLCSRE